MEGDDDMELWVALLFSTDANIFYRENALVGSLNTSNPHVILPREGFFPEAPDSPDANK